MYVSHTLLSQTLGLVPKPNVHVRLLRCVRKKKLFLGTRLLKHQFAAMITAYRSVAMTTKYIEVLLFASEQYFFYDKITAGYR